MRSEFIYLPSNLAGCWCTAIYPGSAHHWIIVYLVCRQPKTRYHGVCTANANFIWDPWPILYYAPLKKETQPASSLTSYPTGPCRLYDASVLKLSNVSFREKCARMGNTLRIPLPTKNRPAGSFFSPASQAGRQAGPVFYVLYMSFLHSPFCGYNPHKSLNIWRIPYLGLDLPILSKYLKTIRWPSPFNQCCAWVLSHNIMFSIFCPPPLHVRCVLRVPLSQYNKQL